MPYVTRNGRPHWEPRYNEQTPEQLGAWAELQYREAQREAERINTQRYAQLNQMAQGLAIGTLQGYGQHLGLGQALGGPQALTIDTINNARELLNANFVDNGMRLMYDAINQDYRWVHSDDIIQLQSELEVERKLNVELTEEGKNMAETIEVPLDKSVLDNICNSLDIFSKSKASEIEYYEEKLKQATKDKYPDKEVREGYLGVFNTRLENTLTSIKLCEKLIAKFKGTARPIKLQKTERKVLANVLDNINIDYSLICPYSNISNINHPDRFFGFPNLEKSMKGKIAELTASIKSLTRSDVNVYVK